MPKAIAEPEAFREPEAFFEAFPDPLAEANALADAKAEAVLEKVAGEKVKSIHSHSILLKLGLFAGRGGSGSWCGAASGKKTNWNLKILLEKII